MTNLVPDELLYQVALSKIEGVGPINCRSIVAYLGSAKEALTTSKPKLEKVPGIGSILSYKLVDQRKKVIGNVRQPRH